MRKSGFLMLKALKSAPHLNDITTDYYKWSATFAMVWAEHSFEKHVFLVLLGLSDGFRWVLDFGISM